MIYKTYKITYENLSKIMDLSIFKTHLNIGKSFSFLIHCNIYAAEIDNYLKVRPFKIRIFFWPICSAKKTINEFLSKIIDNY